MNSLNENKKKHQQLKHTQQQQQRNTSNKVDSNFIQTGNQQLDASPPTLQNKRGTEGHL